MPSVMPPQATTENSNTRRGVTLYSHPTGPNGWKVACVLSELDIPYRTVYVDFSKGDHKNPAFVSICPNGRIPAIVDHDNGDFALWESGAIILYLVQQYDKECTLWARDLKTQMEITAWLMFQVSGHSVMQGQAVYFSFFSAERSPGAISRYINETRRVYGVIEMRLAEQRELLSRAQSRAPSRGEEDSEPQFLTDEETLAQGEEGKEEIVDSDAPVWLVGDHCTVADLSFLTWANVVDRIGVDLETEYPEVQKWVDNMLARPKTRAALSPESTP